MKMSVLGGIIKLLTGSMPVSCRNADLLRRATLSALPLEAQMIAAPSYASACVYHLMGLMAPRSCGVALPSGQASSIWQFKSRNRPLHLLVGLESPP